LDIRSILQLGDDQPKYVPSPFSSLASHSPLTFPSRLHTLPTGTQQSPIMLMITQGSHLNHAPSFTLDTPPRLRNPLQLGLRPSIHNKQHPHYLRSLHDIRQRNAVPERMAYPLPGRPYSPIRSLKIRAASRTRRFHRYRARGCRNPHRPRKLRLPFFSPVLGVDGICSKF